MTLNDREGTEKATRLWTQDLNERVQEGNHARACFVIIFGGGAFIHTCERGGREMGRKNERKTPRK